MAREPKLNQILAVEKGTKERVARDLTDVYHLEKKAAAFSGLIRTFERKLDEDEDHPPQSTIVQMTASEVLGKIRSLSTDLYDVVLTKDRANQAAIADVTVDETVILHGVPATHLLFLEKQLENVRTVVTNIPTLDPAHNWTYDDGSMFYRADPVRKNSTKKLPKPITLYEATDKHPAQVQLITIDKIVGSWTETHLSGAIKATDKSAILARTEKLLAAVKTAREEANTVAAPNQSEGKQIFDFLFG